MSSISDKKILESLRVLSSALDVKQEEISIPISVFKNRKLGMLENAVVFLKEKCKLNYHEIAVLLNRDDRTIWSSYNKAKKKK
jgi:hypothetical protein